MPVFSMCSGGEVSYRGVIIKKASSLVEGEGGGGDYDNLEEGLRPEENRKRVRKKQRKRQVRISPAAEQG